MNVVSEDAVEQANPQRDQVDDAVVALGGKATKLEGWNYLRRGEVGFFASQGRERTSGATRVSDVFAMAG